MKIVDKGKKRIRTLKKGKGKRKIKEEKERKKGDTRKKGRR